MSEEYEGCGQTPGLELWRIEKFKLVKLPVTGKFYDGDSYVLLSTKKSEVKGWDIHFWLGQNTSPDEAGTAAIKTVEIDDYLGGGPVEYREVQGNESSLFLSYFRRTGGIEYLPGGVATGFHHTELGVHRNRLLHVQGRHTIRVKEVPLSNNSLNINDVFILDAGMHVYLFCGCKASTVEKAKAIDVANNIRVFNHQNLCGAQVAGADGESGAQPEIVRIVEEDPHNEGFWGLLGGEIEVPDVPEPPDVVHDERKLFYISDSESGTGEAQFSIVTIGSGGLTRSLLKSDAVYLLDSGDGSLFLWVGVDASQTEKKSSFQFAHKYIADANLPHHTSVQRVVEGVETVEFKGHFSVWNTPPPHPQAKVEEVEGTVDVGALLAAHAEEEDKRLSGSGSITDSVLTVWVIDSFDKVLIPPEKHGLFFDGDSYVVLHEYKDGSGSQYVVYFWLGDESTADEKGTAALKTKEIAASKGANVPQVRVTQGKEPSSFCRLFQGLLCVMTGGRSSGFRNLKVDAPDATGVKLPALFHVKGVGNDTHAVQVIAAASSLNSRDAFLLATVGTMFVWKGDYSSAAERALAARLAQRLIQFWGEATCSGLVVAEVTENEEPEGFWEALGGKAEYAKTREGDPEPRDGRLFHIVDPNISKSSLVEEILQYEQEDLLDVDCYLLDCYTEIYLWIGSQSNTVERARGMRVAERIVSEAKDGRGSVPIIQIYSGHEPLSFTSQFESWDPEYAVKHQYVDPFAKRTAELEMEKKARADANEATLKAEQEKKSQQRMALVEKLEHHDATPATAPVTADEPPPAAPTSASAQPSALDADTECSDGQPSLDMLKRSVSKLPAGVDPAHKELSVSDEDFVTIFKMTRAEFNGLAQWKQNQLKKNAGLF